MAPGLFPPVTAALDARLRANDAAMWKEVWRSLVVRQVVIPEAMRLFDAQTTTFSDDWSSLDNEFRRVAAARAANLDIAAVEDLLAHRNELNAALGTAGLSEERPSGLRRYLHPIVIQLIGEQVSELSLRGIFPWAWQFLANAIARAAHDGHRRLGRPPEDWRALNERLAAAYFASCGLGTAALVEGALRRVAREWPFCIRGRLVRLVEQVSATGIDDVPPPVVSVPHASPPLAHRGLSDLISAAVEAWTNTEAGCGVMHQLLGGLVYRVPKTAIPKGRTMADLVASRTATYRQYEYTIVSYLALAGIEQLLRSVAHRAGIDHARDPVHLWIDDVRPTPVIRDAVAAIYSRDRGNIRNRFMHAGLLDIESKRMEYVLAASRLGPPIPSSDPYAPRNVAALCLGALLTIDAELARTRPLTSADLSWTQTIDLTPDELQFGYDLPFDFGQPQGEELRQQMSDFLAVVTPAVSQLFRVGFVGWIQKTGPMTLPKFAAMLTVFEGLARLVAHLCGVRVLQWDERHCRCQYLMFDERGLASPEVRTRVCAELKATERMAAERTIGMALKVRNAFAHGAVVAPTGRYFDAVGNLVTKASLAFMLAAESHMIREAAFFESQRSGCSEEENWLAAEQQILRRLQTEATGRRLA